MSRPQINHVVATLCTSAPGHITMVSLDIERLLGLDYFTLRFGKVLSCIKIKCQKYLAAMKKCTMRNSEPGMCKTVLSILYYKLARLC